MGRRAAADAGGGTGLAPGGQSGLDQGPGGVAQVGWVGASAGHDTGLRWSHVTLPDAMSVDFDAKVNQTRVRGMKSLAPGQTRMRCKSAIAPDCAVKVIATYIRNSIFRHQREPDVQSGRPTDPQPHPPG